VGCKSQKTVVGFFAEGGFFVRHDADFLFNVGKAGENDGQKDKTIQ
jgi:hypothetical protein